MSKEPLGIAAYNGLAVPVRGESETRQFDSSRTIRTLTHSSDNTGRFYTFRDYGVPGSTLAGVDVAAIDADGGFQALSGSTVKMELNSSGLFAGSGQQMFDNTGKQGQVALNGATTLHVIVSSNAGKIHVISTQADTTVFIHLPSSGNLAVGEVYEFVSNTTDTDLFHFMTTGANAGGEIHAHIGSTGVVVSTGGITNASSGAFWAKFVVLSTVGPIWAASNQMVPTGLPTTAQYFGFIAGSTA